MKNAKRTTSCYVRGAILVSPPADELIANRYFMLYLMRSLPLVHAPDFRSKIDMYITEDKDSRFLVHVNGELKDATFEYTERKFIKWMCEFSNKVFVKELLVGIGGEGINGESRTFVMHDPKPFAKLHDEDCSRELLKSAISYWHSLKTKFKTAQ